MALRSCRECGKRISEHATACPRCGCPVSSSSSSQSASRGPASDSGEITFYSDDSGIRVTNTRVIINNRTYSVANISSVRVKRIPPLRWPFVLLFLFGAIAAPNLFAEGSMGGGFFFALIALGAVVGFFLMKARFKVLISASSGETAPLTTADEEYAHCVADAINEAFVTRG